MLNVNINGFLRNTRTLRNFEKHKSWSAEDAGADNNSSEDGVVVCTTTTDDNLNDEVDPLLDNTNQMSDDADDGFFDKVDLVKLIGEGLLDLKENFYVTSAATCKISEFVTDILRIERRLFAKAIEKSLLRKSHLTLICLILKLKKYCIQKAARSEFCGEKALSNHFKLHKNHTKLVERVARLGPVCTNFIIHKNFVATWRCTRMYLWWPKLANWYNK